MSSPHGKLPCVAVPNLTRTDAAARAELLAVQSYDLQLDVTDGDGHPGERTFRSVTTVEFTARQAGAETFIDLVADTVHSATLNGAELDVSSYTEDGGLPLPGLAEQNTLVVTADCRYSNSGEGLHRFEDPEDGQVYLYTQFEPADAKRMFACFDQPDLKATFTMHVVAPFDWQVVSNTGGRTIEAGPAGSQLAHFEPTKRISTYLVALIAGPYAKVTDSHEGIPLGLYCRASLAKHLDADELFRVTKQGFDFYHRVFDYPYPFDKYDQLFVPEFNAGAMENAGAVTFLEDYVFRSKVSRARYERRAETILHELGHMWFGDLVTMRWWDDLWLNESFATYISTLCQAEATEYTTAWTTFANTEKAWAYAQDQLPSTHPIAADIPDVAAVEVNFDGITYAKGASVLKQLVAYVGRDEFLAGVRRYFRKHEFGNTTLADLLAPLEESSGRDLTEWVEQWLRTSQVNTLRPVFELTNDGRYKSFAIEQTAVTEHPVLRNHRLAVGLYSEGPGGLTRSDRVELDVAGARTEVPELVGHPAADLVLVNDDDLTYAKLRLDERSLGTLRTRIGAMPDPLARALCWSAAWDMTRDAELPAREWVQLVLAGVDAETEISVVQALLARVQTALSLLRRPDLGADRVVGPGRPRHDRAGGGAGGQRHAAAVVTHAGQRRAHGGARRRAARAARRLPHGAGPGGRRRRALGLPLRAGRHRRRRGRRDRRRGRAGRHRDRHPAGRHRPGAAPDGGVEGADLAAGLPRRGRAQRRARGDPAGLLAPRPAGAHRAATSSGTSPRSARCGTAVPGRSPRTPSSTCSRRSSSPGPSSRPTPGWPTPSSPRRSAG